MRNWSMGDPIVPERLGGRHPGAKEYIGVPAMPLVSPGAAFLGTPYPLLYGLNPTLGWQSRPPADGGPAFVIIRRIPMRPLKVIESFPLTEDGWAAAWQSLVRQNPAATTARVLTQLGARELDARTETILREVAFLGGYVPGSAIRPGERYDVRFMADRFQVFVPRQPRVLAAVPYSQVEDVEIGGPGLVKTGGGFVGGGFGVNGAIEGMAIASVLNALTTRTSIKTVLRIQGTGCELFLLDTMLTPEQLRIVMSRPLGAIRSARAAAVADGIQHEARVVSPSPAEELSKLADMLEKGLLTREEFNLMKAKLIGQPPI
jgi:Short C-terminal domain